MCVTYSLVFSVTCLLVPVQCDVHQHTDQAGIRCGNFTGVGEEIEKAEAEHYHCVECLYPQNCLAENQCRLGTSGDTCEKCLNDFHRIGSNCVKCPSFPWPAVSFGVYFLILIGSIFYHGLTDSVCTKVKLLSNFLQNVLLTLHIKIDWPDQLLETFGIINFGKFNSEILYPECLFSSWPSLSAHYLEWITSLSIPVLTILLGKFLDASMKKLLRLEDSDMSENRAGRRQHAWQKRTTVRRLVFMVVVITYMPATLSCIRTYLCSDTIPKMLVFDHTTNVFLLDNTVSCDTFVFQTIHFFATVYLVFVGLFLPPLLIIFTLRQKKWNLLYSQWFLYSPVYEAYKEKFCFWEAFPLLRKLIGIIITEAYPVSAFIQTVTQLGMTGLYLLAVTTLRPYRSCYWVHPNFNVHLFFEVISNLAVCLLQIVGLSIIIQQYQASSDLVLAGCICVVVIVWVVLVLAMICESTSLIDLPQVDVPVSSSSRQPQPHRHKKSWCMLCTKTKVEPDQKFVEKIKENKAKLDF